MRNGTSSPRKWTKERRLLRASFLMRNEKWWYGENAISTIVRANPASLRLAALSRGRGKWGAGVMDGAQRRCIRDADEK